MQIEFQRIGLWKGIGYNLGFVRLESDDSNSENVIKDLTIRTKQSFWSDEGEENIEIVRRINSNTKKLLYDMIRMLDGKLDDRKKLERMKRHLQGDIGKPMVSRIKQMDVKSHVLLLKREALQMQALAQKQTRRFADGWVGHFKDGVQKHCCG